MPLNLFWNNRLQFWSFLRIHLSSIPSLSVGLLYCYLFCSFSHCMGFDLDIFLLFISTWNEFSWTFKDETGFRVAFLISQSSLFCCFSVVFKSMVACFLRFSGSLPLLPLAWTFSFLHLYCLCPAHCWFHSQLFLFCRGHRAALGLLWVLKLWVSHSPLNM